MKVQRQSLVQGRKLALEHDGSAATALDCIV